jgi:hypothetical protein
MLTTNDNVEHLLYSETNVEHSVDSNDNVNSSEIQQKICDKVMYSECSEMLTTMNVI